MDFSPIVRTFQWPELCQDERDWFVKEWAPHPWKDVRSSSKGIAERKPSTREAGANVGWDSYRASRSPTIWLSNLKKDLKQCSYKSKDFCPKPNPKVAPWSLQALKGITPHIRIGLYSWQNSSLALCIVISQLPHELNRTSQSFKRQCKWPQIMQLVSDILLASSTIFSPLYPSWAASLPVQGLGEHLKAKAQLWHLLTPLHVAYV